MTENDNDISGYIDFPRTFEKYKWYKPILVLIVGLFIFLIFQLVLVFIFSAIYGWEFIMQITNGGYEVLNTEGGQIFSDLGIIVLAPSLYLATKIVKDRPFSSYSSSRGGWNSKLYFKAFIIPFILYMIVGAIEVLIEGPKGTKHFTILFFILCLILVPLQCIAEEYIFRGLFMQTLGSWFKIPILAIILQAVIFAVAHSYNSLGVFVIFISGLVFGFFAWKTNGIEVSAAIHTANNLCISLFVMFGLQSTSSTVQLNDTIIAVVFEILLLVIMYYVGKKTDWFGEIKEENKT